MTTLQSARPHAGHRTGIDTVRVIIVTWNSAKTVPHLLESLERGLRGVDVGGIVVVDNGSHDGTPELVERLLPEATVIRTGANLGYAGGINRAAASPDEHVLILNADVVLHDGCVSAMLDELEDPAVGIVVPRILDERGRTSPSLRREPTAVRAWAEAVLGGHRAGSLGQGEMVTRDYDTARDVDWASGAALLVSAQCRDAVGPWDETFFLYSEETDYMLRARDHGFATRYTPRAVVTHEGGDMMTSPALWALQVRNRIALQRRRAGALRSLAFRSGVAANEAVRAIAGRAVHRAGVIAALGGRPQSTNGVVWFGAVDWWYHNRAHSDVQLARELSTSRPVLFVNSIGLRVPLPGRSSQPLRRVARKAASIARLARTPDADHPRFHVVTPLAIPVSRSEVLRRASARLVRTQVTLAAAWYGIGRPDIIATIPTAIDVVEGMPRRSLTFNRSDLHSAFPEADGPAIEELERRLLRESDHVLYVSRELMALDRPLAGHRAHYLDHGVDLELFGGEPDLPADLAAIPRPRIGFFGGIDDYVVDLDLLDLLALQIPEASLVLIGDATCSLERFSSLENVHVLGPRPHSQIPAYGRGFDVAIMPWLDNAWIRFCNPIKLKEYLALGLPVVTTSFPEVGAYREVVYIAHDREEFVSLVRYVLTRPGGSAERKARRARVAGEAWGSKAAELAEIIDGGRA